MVIACLIFMVVMFAVGFPLLCFELNKKKRFPWMGIICATLIGTMFVFGTATFRNQVIDGAEYQVNLCDTPTNAHKEIYYDQTADCYFVIKMNDWDITKMFYRYELDYEEAKAYIEHVRAVEVIDLFG